MTLAKSRFREKIRLFPTGAGGKDETINEAAFEYYTRLGRIQKFTNENYSEEISLGKAAEIATMERTYFCTFFRQKVGITFGEWLRRFRVLRAMEMMGERNYTISHIAYAVGFGDLRTFERAFKEFTGRTPSSFRDSIRPS